MKELPTVIEARDLASPGNDEERRIATLARRVKVLGNTVRLRILKILAAAKDAIVYVIHLAEQVGLDQTTVSRHMSALERAGFLQYVELRGGAPGASHYYVIDQVAIRAAFHEVMGYIGIAAI